MLQNYLSLTVSLEKSRFNIYVNIIVHAEFCSKYAEVCSKYFLTINFFHLCHFKT